MQSLCNSSLFRALAGASVAAAVILFAIPAASAVQSGGVQGRPDLSGVWYRSDAARGIRNPDGTLFVPPMQPWAAEVFEARQRIRLSREVDETGEQGELVLDESGEAAGLVDSRPYGLDVDPVMSCLPAGFPRVFLSVRVNFEIAQRPDRVVMLFEQNRLSRIVYTDGRDFPDGAPPAFMGQSVGRWDGDTLVAETRNLMGGHAVWLDRAGHPQTDALRVTERYRRLDPETLEIEFLFDDPGAYTRPWGGKQVYELQRDWELLEAVLCLDHFYVDHLPEIERLTDTDGEQP